MLLLSAMVAGAQTKPSQTQSEVAQKRGQVNFYRKSLAVDSAKAEQVAQVQESYKKALGLVVADTALNEEGRRAKIGQLIVEKNRRLRLLLNVSQQQKLIPSTEREPVKTGKQP